MNKEKFWDMVNERYFKLKQQTGDPYLNLSEKNSLWQQSIQEIQRENEVKFV